MRVALDGRLPHQCPPTGPPACGRMREQICGSALKMPLVDLMHTPTSSHMPLATSSKVHSTCMGKSNPLYYVMYIQNIFCLHNNQIEYVIYSFIFSSYIIISTMNVSYNQITKIYCNRFPQQRAWYSPVLKSFKYLFLPPVFFLVLYLFFIKHITNWSFQFICNCILKYTFLF